MSREVKLSNPDKVLFPDDGITKAELADHYARVAEVMVPHTRDRPMNLWRWNNGHRGRAGRPAVAAQGRAGLGGALEVPRRKGGDIVHGLINDADDAALAGPAELHHAARVEQPLGQARPSPTGSCSTSIPREEDFTVCARPRWPWPRSCAISG